MDTKHLVRGIAVTCAAGAIAMAMLALRETPPPIVPEVVDVTDFNSDPLPGLLRHCQLMGDEAAVSRLCAQAWAEKRRRFLGIRPDGAGPASKGR
jgi:conjugative transfer region protein TrbK